jgi:chromosome partitioning protein
MAHVIICGNEKGGSGKTTSAMHLIITLLQLGFKVASIDLDLRQKSLTAYIENRIAFADKEVLDLKIPKHHNIVTGEENEFKSLFDKLYDEFDFIVIDTPGSDTALSRLAHSYADTIITPINDSFIDVYLLGEIRVDSNTIKPGVYSAMIWEQKIKKAEREKKSLNWFVLRNRMSSIDSINRRNIEEAIFKISKKFGFSIIPGFGERVIFRELFLHGLTLHDAGITNKVRFNASIVAARQELRCFTDSLNLPGVKA